MQTGLPTSLQKHSLLFNHMIAANESSWILIPWTCSTTESIAPLTNCLSTNTEVQACSFLLSFHVRLCADSEHVAWILKWSLSQILRCSVHIFLCRYGLSSASSRVSVRACFCVWPWHKLATCLESTSPLARWLLGFSPAVILSRTNQVQKMNIKMNNKWSYSPTRNILLGFTNC